ncbi:S8 family serine peptidase [Geovibrio thiophilus]|nr:S8 family serine peptidase [Geovibrio thiophilus]
MRFRLFALFIIALSIFTVSVTQSHADTKPRALNRASLAMKAAKDGYVRVIVGFRSDSYSELIKASRSAKQDLRGTVKKRAAEKADAAVKAETERSRQNALSSIDSKDYIIKRAYDFTPEAAMEVSSEGLSELLNNPLVEYIIEDVPQKLPDTLSSPSAGVDSIGRIGADDAWTAGYTGAGQFVAIVDTGIRRTHEMFAGKNIVEACFSDNDCPDGSDEMYGTGAAAHYESSYTSYDHGSHVAGIAAGNSSSQKGVAKDADIIAIQVFSRFENESACTGGELPFEDCVLSWDSDQKAALEHIYDNLTNSYNIAAVNLSLGGGQYSAYCDNNDIIYRNHVNNLTGAGIAVAIASGNSGYCGYVSSPSCITNAITVGATDISDEEASFSNYLTGVLDVFAPGVNINSAVGSGDSNYETWNGTSMATPHVTGAFAVFKQKNDTLSVSQLETVMKDTRSAVSYGCASHGSEGRINVDSVINSITDGNDVTAPYNVTVSINSGNAYTNSRSVTVSINGADGSGINGYYVSENSTTPDVSAFSSTYATTSFMTNVSFTLSSGDGTKTVYAWLKDEAGNLSTVAADTIVLDTTAPYVMSISPANNSTGVAAGTDISVLFSESVLSSTLTLTNLSLVNQSTMTAVTNGDIAISGNTVTFDPAADLSAGTAYILSITAGIRDQAGNSLNPATQSYFVTQTSSIGGDGDDDNGTDDGGDDDNDSTDNGGSSGGGGGCSAGTEADYALIVLMLISGIILIRKKI